MVPSTTLSVAVANCTVTAAGPSSLFEQELENCAEKIPRIANNLKVFWFISKSGITNLGSNLDEKRENEKRNIQKNRG